MNCEQANTYSIVDYLNKKGILPAFIRGCDYWYYSPNRMEKTPSFKVNIKINRFFDHGSGKGGKLLDLAIVLYPNKSIKEILDSISDNINPHLSFQKQPSLDRHSPLKILTAGPLTNIFLLNYLRSRGICKEVGRKFSSEINYQVRTVSGTRNYFAIGFKNNSGGYELRNKYFKGSTSPKDFTLIKHSSYTLAVFEGWLDYLTWIQTHQNFESDYLVLNSLSLINRTSEIIKAYQNVHLFLDNDQAGYKAKAELLKLVYTEGM